MGTITKGPHRSRGEPGERATSTGRPPTVPPVAWLTSLPAAVLVVAWLGFSLAFAVAGRAATRALVPSGERDHVPAIAAPLMPALGAVFAVLMALTLSSEAGYLRSAQDIVSTEAEAASRLAWAATTPRVQTAEIQTALSTYLRAVRAFEWHGDAVANGENVAVADSIGTLEHAVRAQAASSELGTPTSTELIASLDALTTSRRARISAASRQLPVLYVTTLVVSGAALILNASALTIRASARTSLLVAGLACVVGLSIALLFVLTAPWRGSLVVSGDALDIVLRDLQAGFFRS
jgi:hypothetical protein